MVGRRARVRLHVRVLHAEQFLRALDRERLDLIDVFLALVVALAGIALGVLVVEDRAGRFHHGRRRVVLGRDQPDELVLPPRLERDQAVDLGVGRAQRRHIGHSHSSKLGLNSAGVPLEGAIVYRTARRLRSDGSTSRRVSGGSVASNKLSSLGLILAGIWATSATAEVVRIDVSARADVAGSAAYGAAGPYEKAARYPALRRRPELTGQPNRHRPRAGADQRGGPRRVHGRLLPAEAEGRRPRQRRAAVRGFESRPQGHPADDEPSGRRASIQARRASSATGSCSSKASRCCGSAGSSTRRPAIRCCCASIRRRGTHGVTGLVRSDFVVRTRGRPRLLARRRRPRRLPRRRPRRATRTRLTVRDDAARRAANDSARRLAVRARRRQRQRRGRTRRASISASGFTPKRIYEVVYTAANPPLAGLGLAADPRRRDAPQARGRAGARARRRRRSIARSPSASRRAAACCGRSSTKASTRTSATAACSTACSRTSRAAPAAASTCASRSRRARARATSIRTRSFRSRTPCKPTPSAASATACSMRVAPAFVPQNLLHELVERILARLGGADARHASTAGATSRRSTRTRIYFFAGTQHGPAAFPPRVASGRLPDNPNAYSWFMRSLVLKLDAWVADEVRAAARASIRRSRTRTLVERSQLKFPAIPGVDVPVAPRGPRAPRLRPEASRATAS